MISKNDKFVLLWMLVTQLQGIVNGRAEQQIHLVSFTAEQSSSQNGHGAAGLAVDRNTATTYSQNSCTQTAGAETDPWWSVDMDVRVNVTKVLVLNRGDAHSDRLSNIKVWLSDAPFGSAESQTECGTRAEVVAAGEWATITCDTPTKGRYLTIQLTGDDKTLTLCEVNAYGYRQHVLSRVARNSGTNLTPMKSQYEGDLILPSLETALGPEYFSMEFSEKALYKSPIIDCAWNKIKNVHLSIYTNNVENMYVDFDVSGADDTRATFYSISYLSASSYLDLTASYYQTSCDCCDHGGTFFNIEGQGDRGNIKHKRRFYINCYYNSCGGDVGWFVIFDMDHEDYCDWETTNSQNPVFKYSNTQYTTTAESWSTADVLFFTADLDDTFPDAISSCVGVADGFYHSALACNIYVECDTETLHYKLCSSGKYFDTSTNTCETTSTTCTSTDTAGEGCFPNACSQSPCENDAPCSNAAGGWSCDCKPGFNGETCDTDTCTEGTLCENGGSCTRNNADSFTCACVDGYNGDTCENDIDECANNPCNGNGECTHGIAMYSCACHDGFTGSNCESALGDCDPVDCNNGACEEIIGDYVCNCQDGYTGTHCETDIDECEGSPCGSYGNCTDLVAGYDCTCQTGYTGTTCDTYDGCHDSPCQNGGTCTDSDDSASEEYTCTCATGYVGLTCQTQTICSSDPPCEHGSCVDEGSDGTAYTCECDDGFEGTNCDQSTQQGSAGAQEGDDAAGSSVFTSNSFMFGLVGAVGFACLIIIGLTVCLILGAKRRKKEEEEEEKRAKSREAWSKKMDEKQLQSEQNNVQKTIEQKAARKQETLRTLEKSIFDDY